MSYLFLPLDELVTGPILSPSLKLSNELNSLNQDFLIGTASESIDFWPGPVDLSTWTWTQYVKYVTTSLDSFGPKLSNLALSLYPPKKVDLPLSSLPSSTSQLNIEKSASDMSHFSYSFTPNGKNDERKIESNDESNSTEESPSNNEVVVEDTFTISLSPSVTSTESPLKVEEEGEGEGKIEASASNVTSNAANVSSFSSSAKVKDGSIDVATLPSNSNHLPTPSQPLNVSQVSSTVSLTSTSISPSFEKSIDQNVKTLKSKSIQLFDSPEKLYSSLVSDVRQTCPVQRLARQLVNQIGSGQNSLSEGHSIGRIYLYTVTGQPSVPVSNCCY